MQDLIVYVHVPFCSSKCHFCSWTSPIPTSELVNKKAHSSEYKTAVVRQLKDFGTAVETGAAMRLIYFGGGTPSLMEAGDLGGILESIHSVFRSNEAFQDTTIEIAPETVNLDKLRDLRAAGFTRVSFGFQSLDEQRVRQIGRAHSATQAVQAFGMAREAGFDNINIDLMLGFPDETDREWEDSLTRALSLSPNHLSLYIYKMIPGTVMATQIERATRKATPTPVAVRRYLDAADRLTAAGYHEYMFQLFARDGKRCFCDQSYFNLDADHVGFGAGAHSLLNGHLMGHSPDLGSYLRRPRFQYRVPIADSANVLQTKLHEMLHTDGGIDPARVEKRLQISLTEARRRYGQIDAFFEDLMRSGATSDAQGCFLFRNKQDRAAWLGRQPQHYDVPEHEAPPENTLQIAAAS
jgi:putative oxygen-independent coproporphyrinogen III oxidase